MKTQVQGKIWYEIGFLREKCYRRRVIPAWAKQAGND